MRWPRPMPQLPVAHSPTPSIVRMAASANGEGKKAGGTVVVERGDAEDVHGRNGRDAARKAPKEERLIVLLFCAVRAVSRPSSSAVAPDRSLTGEIPHGAAHVVATLAEHVPVD